jgi:hypothetical protein
MTARAITLLYLALHSIPGKTKAKQSKFPFSWQTDTAGLAVSVRIPCSVIRASLRFHIFVVACVAEVLRSGPVAIRQ